MGRLGAKALEGEEPCATGIGSPYLTIVATSRNDGHGGNLLRRMQLFVNGLLSQCRRYRLDAEFVLVEWNPPPDRPRLVDALRWPGGPCCVRIIEVPPHIHMQFKHSKMLPLFQMIAKNVAIRRAQGRFVLATNVDILFSNELMSFLASGSLRKECMYRVDRHDVPPDVPLTASTDEQLDFCKRNAFRVCRRDGTYNLRSARSGRTKSRTPSVRGEFREISAQFLPAGVMEYLRGFKTHLTHRAKPVRLHTNASGDFTLMAREQWFRVRGYPELHMFSPHLDSLLCYVAYYAGVKEVVLPYRIFHIEHSGTLARDVERTSEDLDKPLSKAGVPQLTWKELQAWATRMHRERRPIILNDENWGLAQESFPETTVGKNQDK